MRHYINIIEGNGFRPDAWRVWFNAVSKVHIEVSNRFDHMQTVSDDLDTFGITDEMMDQFDELDSEEASDFLMVCAFQNRWVRVNAGSQTSTPYVMGGSLRDLRIAAKWLLDRGFYAPLYMEHWTEYDAAPHTLTLQPEDLEKFATRGILPRKS